MVRRGCWFGCLVFAVVSASIDFAAAQPSGRIAVSILTEHHVEIYSATGEALAVVPTGIGPRGFALYDGLLYVANRGTDRAAGSDITVIDLAKLQPIRTIQACAACAPRAVSFDAAGTMWISGQKDQAVYWLKPPYRDPAGSAIVAWGWPQELTRFNGANVMVVGMRSSNELGVIDATNPAKVPRVQRVVIGPVPDHVAARPHTNEVWASTNPMGHLAILTLAPDGTVSEPKIFKVLDFLSDLAFTPDGELVVVTATGRAADLAVVDATTHKTIGSLDMNGYAQEFAISPDGKYAAVSMQDDDEKRWLAVVELADGKSPKVINTIPIGGVAGDVIWLP